MYNVKQLIFEKLIKAIKSQDEEALSDSSGNSFDKSSEYDIGLTDEAGKYYNHHYL